MFEGLAEQCVAGLQHLAMICFLEVGSDHRTPACCAKGSMILPAQRTPASPQAPQCILSFQQASGHRRAHAGCMFLE